VVGDLLLAVAVALRGLEGEVVGGERVGDGVDRNENRRDVGGVGRYEGGRLRRRDSL
jgi:hypothetical protein